MGDARARRRPRSRRQLGEQEQIEGRVHSTAPIDRAPCFACANHRRVGLKLSPDASAYVSIRDPAPAGLEILESPGLLPSPSRAGPSGAGRGARSLVDSTRRRRTAPLAALGTRQTRACSIAADLNHSSHNVPHGAGHLCARIAYAHLAGTSATTAGHVNALDGPLTCSTPAWTRESVQSVHSKLSQKKVTPFHSPLVSAVQIILH